MYSKFLKESSSFTVRILKTVRFSHRNETLLSSYSKVCWGANIYLDKCHYSTILNPRQTIFPKYTSRLNFAAHLSTGGTTEQYNVVITNPSEGTSTTLVSALNSADEIKTAENISTFAPEITDVATPLTDILPSAVELIEPSLASIGLCNWTPVGLIQMMLEWMHVSMHWPWWLSIVTTTVIARILLFPLLLKTQRNAINMSNHMPQLQFLQRQFAEARRTGNSMEAARLANEIMLFMNMHKINPVKSSLLPLLQAPVFLSFFFALRSMANAPVESMKYGGLSWVTDLTIPDPYYVLPLVACGTMYVVIKVGAESGVKMENLKLAKYVMQALPLIALPFCINFPSAILYYWCSNNFMTLIIVSILRIKPVRLYFNLPQQQPIDPKLAPPKKGFIQNMKDSFEDQKVLAAIEDRRRIDEVRFQKAGTGPIPRTYSYDPTKPRPANAASTAMAKQRKV